MPIKENMSFAFSKHSASVVVELQVLCAGLIHLCKQPPPPESYATRMVSLRQSFLPTARASLDSLGPQVGSAALKDRINWEFPGGLVVRILGFHCHGPGSIPGQGTEIPTSRAKTPRFHCRGRGFDPWSGKFRMPHGEAKNKVGRGGAGRETG